MKRGWIGLGLLLVLLAGSIAVTRGMDAGHTPLSRDLERASGLALSGEWDEAAQLAEAAREEWENKWNFGAAFADHEPMEEIDGLFAQVEVYIRAREEVSFAAVCAELAKRLEAMGDAHGLTWWNLL